LFEQFKRAFEVIPVNAPAVRGVIDTAVLARVVDGVVLVVDRRAMPRGEVVRAAQMLRENGAQLLGVILTRVPARSSLPALLNRLLGPG
jgi:Mrp family chromosome partitioning ATPase